jgi:hypothetical protein
MRACRVRRIKDRLPCALPFREKPNCHVNDRREKHLPGEGNTFWIFDGLIDLVASSSHGHAQTCGNRHPKTKWIQWFIIGLSGFSL